MSFDPSEFESADEHVDNDYIDYLEEMHPPINEDDLNELEYMETDYIIVEEIQEFSELNFEETN